MILPTQNKQLARDYFETLPSADESRRYFDGQKYETPKTWFGRLFNSFFVASKVNTLTKFYPYQQTVKATAVEMEVDRERYTRNSLIFTGVAWTALFQFARRGFVFPLLREYGTWFGTHRLFRHYAHALVLPLALSYYLYKSKWYTHVEHLWIVHANRLNAQILEDPLYTFYPKSEDDAPRRTVFVTPQYQYPEPLKSRQTAYLPQEEESE